MIKTTFCALLVCVGLLIAGMQSKAHALVLDLSSSEYMGFVDPGSPANPVNEVGYINTLKDVTPGTIDTDISGRIYDRTNSNTIGDTAGPLAVLAGAVKDETDPFDLATAFQYVIGKYGNVTHVWYNPTGFSHIDMGIVQNTSDGGLSHTSSYNPVPEPTTVALLGIGLVGIVGAGVRRRRKEALK